LLDINLFRQQPDLIRQGLQKRQMDASVVDQVLLLDEKRRQLIQQVETLKAERNMVSKEIGRMKDPAEREQKIAAMRRVGEQITALDEEVRQVEDELHALLVTIPNLPDERTPLGKDSRDNVVIRTVGEIGEFAFTPQAHWDLGPALGILDFERGVKMSGSRFYALCGSGARLQRALISWMLDVHIRQGYREIYPPFMVKSQTVFGAGELPKFAENMYKDHEEDLWLVPTAEVPLTGLHQDEILAEDSLPRRYTAYTPCFRREKMSAGRDVRGIKRGHQFDKVEMYIYCKPEDSDAELDKMLKDAEQICLELGLTYRVLQLCSGDLSEKAQMTYDIEVWSPGVNEWLEVSSISKVGDYQARRANIKYRPEKGPLRFLHTLNGSGLALPRTLIAVLENYQQADGSVIVPAVLRPWMGGIETITAEV